MGLFAVVVANMLFSPHNFLDRPTAKCPWSTLLPPPPFSKSWNFSVLQQLVGSELCICLLGVFHHLGILLRDSVFCVHRLPGRCALGLQADYSLTWFPFKADVLRLFHVVHVSIFNSRPGISGHFLMKLYVFLSSFSPC